MASNSNEGARNKKSGSENRKAKLARREENKKLSCLMFNYLGKGTSTATSKSKNKSTDEASKSTSSFINDATSQELKESGTGEGAMETLMEKRAGGKCQKQ